MKINNILKNKEIMNASWLIGGKALQMILSLFVGIITARYLGPKNYGLINYGTAFVSFFTAFCTLGINNILVKEFVDNPAEQGIILGSTLVLRTISSLLSLIMIIVIVFILDKEELLTILVVVLCSFTLIFQVFDTFNYWFQSNYQSKVTAVVTLISYIVTSIYKIILLIAGASVQWFAFATSIDYIVVAILLLIAYRKYNGLPLKFSMKKSKKLLNSSYHYILSGMMVAIYGQTDKLMLKQMLDEKSVGYYSIATTVCTMWVFILGAIIDSVYPTIMKLYYLDYDKYEKKNKQLYAIVFWISIGVSIFFWFFSDIVINILYGTKYLLASRALKIITWYTAFSYLGVARNAWIVCEGKQQYLKYMYLSAALINVLLNYLMIPVWGVEGAALASLITQICTSIILPLFFRGMRYNSILILQAIIGKGIFWKKNKGR